MATALKPPPLTAPGSKTNYNAVPIPSNYVPGLGRGATGFTTRSDIGPARVAPEMPAGGMPAKRGDDEPEDLDENKFDEFMGNDEGVLAGTFGEYDQDDKEADAIWSKIDDHMDSRRREKREKRLKEELEKYRADNPKITEQFADLKRKLGEMSRDEWEALPEIGDYTIKKKVRQSFVPVPDTLLEKAAAEKKVESALDARTLSGLETPGGANTDLTAVGEGRGKVLGLKLDRMADSVTGSTVVDPRGYLTDLKSMKFTSDAEISDIKKARLLLKSVISTNPKHPPGWIAAARLEEVAGKLSVAREMLARGCEECPTSEDIWLEAARLQTPENAKAVLARGVAAIPMSVKLWMQAARLEADDVARARVLRKGLERIPNSVRLWKAAVELANEEDARILLSRAVECCPQHVELWLALARLESYENARKVLNRARPAIPTEPAIWITAAKLEESNDNKAMVEKIIERGLKSLQANSVVIDREAWLKEAEAAERNKPPLPATCAAIVRAVIGLGVEEEDRKRTWTADAAEALKRGSVETARAILQHARSVFKTKKSIWRQAAMLEKAHGDRGSLEALLQDAVRYCPKAVVLWLMAAKEQWLAGNVEQARAILGSAFAANPDSEEIMLAAFKLEFENQEPERARALLAKAREIEQSSTQRIWMKSAMVERELGSEAQERGILEEGIRRFPYFDKLYLMLGQLEERRKNMDGARAAYAAGLRRCIASTPLWKSAARVEEAGGSVARARAILEQGRLKCPANPELWLAAVRTERRAGNDAAAEALMARALQECQNSGVLWAEAVAMAPRPQRKGKSVDALKKCNDDPHVIAAVAQLFWNDRKVDKARAWFNRAVTLEPDLGDCWALYYKFELQHGTPEQAAEVLRRCVAAEPHHGERWARVAKDPANAHQPVEVLLKRVVLDLKNTPIP